MTMTIILLCAAILVGMGISVKAFGTGGRRMNAFNDIYFSIEEVDSMGVLYAKSSEYSVIMQIENPVQQHCADIDSYYQFNRLFSDILTALGEGYALHKQDIFVSRDFDPTEYESSLESPISSSTNNEKYVPDANEDNNESEDQNEDDLYKTDYADSSEQGLNEEDRFNSSSSVKPSDSKHSKSRKHPSADLLSRSYFDYFRGRRYTQTLTYLTITQEAKKSSMFSYDQRSWNDFLQKVRKVYDKMVEAGVKVKILNKEEAIEYVDRFMAMNFTSKNVTMDNLKVTTQGIVTPTKQCRIFSLVDVDAMSLPSEIRPYKNTEISGASMPVDIMSHLNHVPSADMVVYNQVLFIPNQKKEMSSLEKKKNRHASMPSPANLAAVEDIKNVQSMVARQNKALIYAHYNLMVVTPTDTDIQRPINFLENAFSLGGIHLSKRSFNQLELFVNSFAGNCYNFSSDYDRFLTLSDSAICLMYKERSLKSEDTPLKIFYTDRQGLPVAIDITGKEGVEKLTDNSNFFCLGPSGSGKSFHMNSVVRQLHQQGTDVVMVDTGNSYQGLCEFLGGKYISYTEDKPITMNPFKITREELEIEKVNFLKNLVLQIWKGSDSTATDLEIQVAEQLILEYYQAYFDGFDSYTPLQRSSIEKKFINEAKRQYSSEGAALDKKLSEIPARIDALENHRRSLKVTELSFNSFYEYSIEAIGLICAENNIKDIDLNGYSYMIRPFYRGGRYDKTLNEQVDTTLFNESFIVFEIDAIKDSKALFPIVTLIIMDVFLQKMRQKKNRKVLIIEEAWKALATPLMAEYIKYLYKTARKFWASVGVVTQEIQDIISSDIVKEAIINNSDVVMLLDQSKFRERFDNIKAILGLTDIDCRKIFTINRLDNKEGRSFFREVFIRRGCTSGVYGVEESRHCYMTYTTERAEKEALQLYRRLIGGTIEEAVETYVRHWNLSGIEKSLAFATKVLKENRILYPGK